MVAEETFGARLRRLREEAGLTQQELAERAGMHRFGVAKLERDERQPSWATVQALARALGVNCLAFEGTAEPGQGKPRPPARRGRPPKAPPPAPPPGKKRSRRKKGE
jgi:transcriptional regulator with XRE-family HTH domain